MAKPKGQTTDPYTGPPIGGSPAPPATGNINYPPDDVPPDDPPVIPDPPDDPPPDDPPPDDPPPDDTGGEPDPKADPEDNDPVSQHDVESYQEGEHDTEAGDRPEGWDDPSSVNYDSDLINSDFFGDGIDAGSAPAVGGSGGPYSESGWEGGPTEWEVTDDQLTSKQMEKLMKRGNPLFDMVEARGQRLHAAGGGQNSAMGGQAATMALLDKAFEIGNADAMVYARSAEFNAAMANQFSLAEQAFVHNSLLSDQNFRQAGALQTQRIQGQLDSIALEFKGRFKLAEFDQAAWMERAAVDQAQFMERLGATFDFDAMRMDIAQGFDLEKMGVAHGFDMENMDFQAFLNDEQAQRDFVRTWQLQGVNSMTNFFGQGMAGLANILSNPNLTPEQARAAGDEYLATFRPQMDILQSLFTNPVNFQAPDRATSNNVYNSDWGNYLMYFMSGYPWGQSTGQGGAANDNPDSGQAAA